MRNLKKFFYLISRCYTKQYILKIFIFFTTPQEKQLTTAISHNSLMWSARNSKLHRKNCLVSNYNDTIFFAWATRIPTMFASN